ncbi:hypothetical protein BASA81_015936 [Batrachochytrium salamandrivorans]|nr:hypothetical protein BASA81_015936 [Batrachochytrium salamandrivorans]
MKFNALVVAAMVITSVNAVFLGKLSSEVENSGDKSGSVVPSSVIRKLDTKAGSSGEEKSANDSNMRDTENNPACRRVYPILKDLQEHILKLSEEYHDHRLALCKIKGKTDNSKSDEADEYLKSHSTTSATMQRIKQKTITLKGEHEKAWMSFANAGCLNQSNQLLSSGKIGGMKFSLGSLLSDPFPVQRGVRQGCPLSELLFNLFINDILDGIAPITVPGLSQDTNPIRGLMYADDVAVFADSEQPLLAASTAVEQWANWWEMQFGVAKCGIISFTGHLAPRLDNPLDIRLHGQLVSRVELYKYLGVLIDSKLDHPAWLKQKRSALEHAILALHPVLANHQLTVNYRSRVFSAVVMGKAYYGLELVGGNKSHLAPLQTTINKGIRLFTGARLSTAIGPLLVETGIGSLLTCSLVARLVRSQRWFWSRRTKQLYRNRYWLTPQDRLKTVKQRHSFALMETLRAGGDSASLQKYVTRQLLDTFGFFKDPSFDQ